MGSYETAIFDMDGTVLDTLTDLTEAVNYAMEKTGHQAGFTREDTAVFFGSAVHVAIQRALASGLGWDRAKLLTIGTKGQETVPGVSEEETARIEKVYRPYYDAHCGQATKPYPGILDLLTDLRKKGVRCAVVSNKPDEAVRSLVDDLFPASFDFALGQKEGIRRKPEPDMVETCLKALGTGKQGAVYIGDSEIDLRTARNSGLPCISVTWGFRPEDYLIREGARVLCHNAGELEKAILEGRD